MVIEEHFEVIMGKIIKIFKELKLIVTDIKENFVDEYAQDPRLNLKIVNSNIDLISSTIVSFRSYKNRNESSWSLETDIKYISQKIGSFFIQFDNPFLGSQKWYQRIVQLLDQLMQESRELDRLLDINNINIHQH